MIKADEEGAGAPFISTLGGIGDGVLGGRGAATAKGGGGEGENMGLG